MRRRSQCRQGTGVDQNDVTDWRVLVLDTGTPEGAAQREALIGDGRVRHRFDTIEEQLRDLVKIRSIVAGSSGAKRPTVKDLLGDQVAEHYGRWVFFPWSGHLVHLLPPAEFHEVRLDRNRNKIRRDEQQRLQGASVGVVGLSVGNAVALTLAMEGSCGRLKLADFDRLDLSNMNRIRAGVHDIGLPKTVLAARQILELDPYLRIELFHEGIGEATVDAFLDGLDVLVDECDSVQVKFLLRQRARSRRIPVLMETSDRGMLDVERFDEEPQRPIFHGLVPDLTPEQLGAGGFELQMRILLGLVGVDAMSARMGASMLEIGRTTSTWPQLASDVALGGATAAVAVRRILLGESLPSGRKYVDLQDVVSAPGSPSAPLAGAALPSPLPGVTPTHRRVSASPIVRSAMEAAVLAPSGGNAQAWHLHYDGDELWIRVDPTRSQTLLDQRGRASLLSIGAMVENAALRATATGHGTLVRWLPSPGVAAHLRFGAPAGPAHDADRRLEQQITVRATNRRLGKRIALTPSQQLQLTSAAADRGAALDLITEAAALSELGAVLGTADHLRALCPALHRDLIGELRWTREEAERSGDGIDLQTLELLPAQQVALRVGARPDVVTLLRAAQGGQALQDGARQSIAAAAAVGLLGVEADDDAAWLAAGRALQRVWLAAAAEGLALQPMSSLLFMLAMLDGPDAAVFDDGERRRLLQLKARFETVFPGRPARGFLFRLSTAAPPTARSLRLPLEAVATAGRPAEIAS
jgi:molybdopterin/thiamine biosynthesis adenylyltransferase/nitroreductase